MVYFAETTAFACVSAKLKWKQYPLFKGVDKEVIAQIKGTGSINLRCLAA